MAQFRGRDRLIARMLYVCGLRIGECVSLRVKDIDFERRQVIVRDTKDVKIARLSCRACR